MQKSHFLRYAKNRATYYTATFELKTHMKNKISQIIETTSTIILGKEDTIKLAVTCLFANGHILLEDLPGVGKTTLALTLSKVFGLEYQRVQFTSDLLPADLLGVSIFNRDKNSFDFHPGPVFNQILLADEINRATPKAQSALLEAMEEGQVSVEGATRQLPSPFFVIATQNPTHQIGTFPLPESQLDRFLMCLHLGYPDHKAEKELLRGKDRRQMLSSIKPIMTTDELIEIQLAASNIHASDAILDYLQSILDFTRNRPEFVLGLSPRSGLALLSAAKAWALVHDKDEIIPEDIQAVLPAVTRHRLFSSSTEETNHIDSLPQFLIDEVEIP
jgi:MoxR-like ATPase